MRHILILFFLILSAQLSAQTYTVRKSKTPQKRVMTEITTDSIVRNSITEAGFRLKKSANLQYAAIGSALGAGIFAGIAINSDHKFFYAPAGIFALGAGICEIFAIHHKMEAGHELILSGNKIQFKF